MNENNNQQKIDLVNPLNPNQIIKTEILNQNIYELTEQQENVNETSIKKKKNNWIVPLLLVLIIIGIGAYYILFM